MKVEGKRILPLLQKGIKGPEMVVVAMADHTEGDAAGIDPQDLHIVDEPKLGEAEVKDKSLPISIDEEGQTMLCHRVFGPAPVFQQRCPLHPFIGGEQDIGVIIDQDGDRGFFYGLQIGHGHDL